MKGQSDLVSDLFYTPVGSYGGSLVMPIVAWSPCSNMLAAASFDATVTIWDRRSGGICVYMYVCACANLAIHPIAKPFILFLIMLTSPALLLVLL